jgi:hypothetical protein
MTSVFGGSVGGGALVDWSANLWRSTHEHLVFDRPLYSDGAQLARFRTLLLSIILAPELLHAADVFLIDNMIVALRH